VDRCSDTPNAALRRGVAPNDATCEDPAVPGAEFEPQALHAIAAVNRAGVASTDAASSVRPASFQLLPAARAHRSVIIGELVVAAIRAVVAIARRAHARHRQRRQATAVYDALRQLDDHTLRDLGFDRSEMTSVAAEVTGAAQRTRVRALLTSNNP